jgi:hypothetical protein
MPPVRASENPPSFPAYALRSRTRIETGCYRLWPSTDTSVSHRAWHRREGSSTGLLTQIGTYAHVDLHFFARIRKLRKASFFFLNTLFGFVFSS